MQQGVFLAGSFLLFSTISISAQTRTVGWPDTIALLTLERSQAQACVDMLKASGDKAAITQGRVAYVAAKAAADRAIAGFITALVEGGKPEHLPGVQADLEKAGVGLKDVCDAAVKAARAAEGTKGVIEEIAAAASGPVIDALKSAATGLWTRRIERDKVEQVTIKGQLEAAKWPDFVGGQ
jgi:hypothetical protein